MARKKAQRKEAYLGKSPTGIRGLDDITGGGLPSGRSTLVCGGAGCGKTLFAIEFLVHGALQHGEPGVFMSFEETAADLAKNVASLGVDLQGLIASKQLVVDYVHIERSEIEETGEFDLEGLFVRLAYAIDAVGAKRVALDTVEALFGGLPNPALVRAELRRLFRWLKERGVAAVITGEQGEHTLTRHGIEEYVSDCVIVLNHRVTQGLSTRQLRVVKYRGSMHGTNEYPFLIDAQGILLLPITSLGLEHAVTDERIPTGISRLDTMLGGRGYYRGSTVLVSGTAGSGKTSVAAHFADATCRRGERCLYFLFEESPEQVIRDMRSIGLDLEPWRRKGVLRFHAARPSLHGLEMHLSVTLAAIAEFDPRVVIVDPVSALGGSGSALDVHAMLTRLVDFLKVRGTTTLLTNLTTSGSDLEGTEAQISSVIDSWLLLRDLEAGGERNRVMYVLKSRGMAHSNQLREFLLTDHGIELTDVYIGPAGVLTGSGRLAQEAREEADRVSVRADVEQMRAAWEHRRRALDSQVAALQAELAAGEVEANQRIRREEQRQAQLDRDRDAMARLRGSGGADKQASRPGRTPAPAPAGGRR